MGTTATYALRYPELTDTPDGATQIKNLANDTDAAIVAATATQFLKPVFARKTADEARASNTTVADDGPTGGSLALAGLVAGAVYRVEGVLMYDGGAGASAGLFDWKFSVPAGSTMTYSYSRENPSGSYTGAYPAAGSTTVTANTTGVGTTMSVTLNGLLVCASNGTLKLQWAQDVSKATATHLLTNSWLSARRVV